MKVYAVYCRLSRRHQWECNAKTAVYGPWTDELARERSKALAESFQQQAIGNNQPEYQTGERVYDIESLSEVPYSLPRGEKMDWYAAGSGE